MTSAAEWLAPMSPGIDNSASETIDVGSGNVDYADGSIGFNGDYGGGALFVDQIEYADVIKHILGLAVGSSFTMNCGLNT